MRVVRSPSRISSHSIRGINGMSSAKVGWNLQATSIGIEASTVVK